jgi:hypothetical protein
VISDLHHDTAISAGNNLLPLSLSQKKEGEIFKFQMPHETSHKLTLGEVKFLSISRKHIGIKGKAPITLNKTLNRGEWLTSRTS